MTAVHPFSCPRAESVEIFSQQICNTICFLFQIYRLHVRGVVILCKNYSGERYFSPLKKHLCLQIYGSFTFVYCHLNLVKIEGLYPSIGSWRFTSYPYFLFFKESVFYLTVSDMFNWIAHVAFVYWNHSHRLGKKFLKIHGKTACVYVWLVLCSYWWCFFFCLFVLLWGSLIKPCVRIRRVQTLEKKLSCF